MRASTLTPSALKRPLLSYCHPIWYGTRIRLHLGVVNLNLNQHHQVAIPSCHLSASHPVKVILAECHNQQSMGTTLALPALKGRLGMCTSTGLLIAGAGDSTPSSEMQGSSSRSPGGSLRLAAQNRRLLAMAGRMEERSASVSSLSSLPSSLEGSCRSPGGTLKLAAKNGLLLGLAATG